MHGGGVEVVVVVGDVEQQLVGFVGEFDVDLFGVGVVQCVVECFLGDL